MAIDPDSSQLEAIAAAANGPDDGPIVMLNMNRYRERAAYEGEVPGGADPDVGGREAYARYGQVAMAMLGRLGARILWHAGAEMTVIGEPDERYDEVIAVWYPSHAAFLELTVDPEVVPALAHRTAGLERATIICCESGPEAELTGF